MELKRSESFLDDRRGTDVSDVRAKVFEVVLNSRDV